MDKVTKSLIEFWYGLTDKQQGLLHGAAYLTIAYAIAVWLFDLNVVSSLLVIGFVITGIIGYIKVLSNLINY